MGSNKMRFTCHCTKSTFTFLAPIFLQQLSSSFIQQCSKQLKETDQNAVNRSHTISEPFKYTRTVCFSFFTIMEIIINCVIHQGVIIQSTLINFRGFISRTQLDGILMFWIMLHYQLQEFPFLKSYLRARNVSKNEKYMFTNVILMNRILQNTDRGI